MAQIIDLTDQVFGRLTVTGKSAEARNGQRMWHCQCSCGAGLEVRGNALRSGKTQSCGCLQREQLAAVSTKHGHSGRGKRTRTYRIWCNMWSRVTNPKLKSYADYGAKGVTISPRWETYAGFLADMGEAPDGLTLEREDVTGNYELGNCVWDTRTVQANNKRTTRRYLVDGEGYTQAELQRMWNLSPKLTRKRLRELGLLTNK